MKLISCQKNTFDPTKQGYHTRYNLVPYWYYNQAGKKINPNFFAYKL